MDIDINLAVNDIREILSMFDNGEMNGCDDIKLAMLFAKLAAACDAVNLSLSNGGNLPVVWAGAQPPAPVLQTYN